MLRDAQNEGLTWGPPIISVSAMSYENLNVCRSRDSSNPVFCRAGPNDLTGPDTSEPNELRSGRVSNNRTWRLGRCGHPCDSSLYGRRSPINRLLRLL